MVDYKKLGKHQKCMQCCKVFSWLSITLACFIIIFILLIASPQINEITSSAGNTAKHINNLAVITEQFVKEYQPEIEQATQEITNTIKYKIDPFIDKTNNFIDVANFFIQNNQNQIHQVVEKMLIICEWICKTYPDIKCE